MSGDRHHRAKVERMGGAITDPQAVVSELARVKVLFQARALAAIMGAPLPMALPPVVRLGQSGGQIAEVLDSPSRNDPAMPPQ